MSFLALFTSTGTLLCCAIPACIALLAGGAAIGTYVTLFPWVIPLSRHSGAIFIVAGVMISISAVFTLMPKSKLACSVTGGKGCEVAGTWTKAMFWFSVAVYSVGGFMTYAVVPLMRWFD